MSAGGQSVSLVLACRMVELGKRGLYKAQALVTITSIPEIIHP